VADWTNETNHQVWWITTTNWLCIEMNVTESKTHKCDLQLDNITEEEHQAMFLEGIRTLVNEAREGNVGDYIVLPYDYTPETIKSSTATTVEIDDETVDALVQIGAVSMITKGLNAIKEDDEYYKNLKDFIDNDSTEDWEDSKEGM
jgi:hypothetical protein